MLAGDLRTTCMSILQRLTSAHLSLFIAALLLGSNHRFREYFQSLALLAEEFDMVPNNAVSN